LGTIREIVVDCQSPSALASAAKWSPKSQNAVMGDPEGNQFCVAERP
jgi:hypothetical protein